MAGRKIDLIYCANGNAKFAGIAIDHGFTYGAQLPGTVYHPIEFADQDWRKPDRERYMEDLQKHEPRIATVLDLESDEQLPVVLSWAEEATQHCQTVIIIPKVFGIASRLPRWISGKEVRLGYSVPTNHGGTELPLWEFSGWPVHLLGGSPGQQMRLAHYLDVKSADGNMMLLMATRHCAFWTFGKRPFANKWPSLKQANNGIPWKGGATDADAPYEAFRRSCVNIMEAWKNL